MWGNLQHQNHISLLCKHPYYTFKSHPTTSSHPLHPILYPALQPQTTPTMTHHTRADAESSIKRNPHPDFHTLEKSRPPFTDDAQDVKFTQTKSPGWIPGQGGNDGGASLEKKHVEIDPYEEGRQGVSNYKLLISGVAPRFIGLVSTVAGDGMWCFFFFFLPF